MTQTLASSRLRALAQRSASERRATAERCELCGEPIGPSHRHVLDLVGRELLCACRPCALLFDSPAAGAGHYRLVPERRLRIDDLTLDDLAWEELRVPVDMAFFFHSSAARRVQAFYPGPMGATESLLGLEAWADLAAANPILQTLAPDVEALLVNRARGAHRQWIVPIDECYALVGLIRGNWRGLTGGKEVWQQIARFYDELDRRARPASREDG
ncbi:MAG TPA: DUF5947 family protein [Solirubrobacteraceae bacterium]